MREMRKCFSAYTPGEARNAASAWLRNFKEHGPLQIRSIAVAPERDFYVATVSYSEMTVETTPQYFAGTRPMLRAG